jgi:putative aminopeptidase
MAAVDLDLIRTLTDLPGVAGHEDVIIGFVRHRLDVVADAVTVDGIGNVIARTGGRRDGPTVMVFAHLDQIGFCVERLQDDGFVRVDRIGGVNRKALVAAPVLVHTDAGDTLPGIGFPMRYSHSPVEMVCLDDVAATVDLLTHAIARVDASLDLSRGIPWSG